MLLEARGLLYGWLKAKYEGAIVEQMPEDLKVPRPFDACVETEKARRFGYWTVDRGIRDRKPMQEARDQRVVSIQWVFLKQLLELSRKRGKFVRLSTTERDLLTPSEFARPFDSAAASLHYLDVAARTVTTLRGVRLFEAVALYRVERLRETPLHEVLISPRTGEFVHPGETQHYQEWLERERAQASKSGEAQMPRGAA